MLINAGATVTNKSVLVSQLKSLGLAAGDTVMVHASLRAVGPTEDRAAGLIAALLSAAGPGGTVMAYVDFEPTEALPYFDKQRSPARAEYGVLAEAIRTYPGAVRSGNPGASVAAIGEQAVWLCADHPMNYGYGPGSPLCKLTETGGKVLLLGSDLDQVTLLHFAEHSLPLPDKRVIHRIDKVLGADGRIKEIVTEEFDTSQPVLEAMPAKMFELITRDFIAGGRASAGHAGRAKSYLLPAKELVDFALVWMMERFK